MGRFIEILYGRATLALQSVDLSMWRVCITGGRMPKITLQVLLTSSGPQSRQRWVAYDWTLYQVQSFNDDEELMKHVVEKAMAQVMKKIGVS